MAEHADDARYNSYTEDGMEYDELPVDFSEWGELISLEEETDYVNLLVYGKSGAGKTVFGGSDDRVLFIAPEDKGTLSAKRMGSKALKWPVHEWNDIERAYNKLYEAQENGGIPFNWVVIDSLTYMQQLCRAGILKAAVEENPERDPDTLQIQEWGKWQEKFKRFVLAFNDLDVNVLYTCLLASTEDEEGNTLLTPDLQGTRKLDMSQLICSYMTSFGCLQVRRRKVKEGDKETTEEYRRITWRDTGTIQGKDRTGVLSPHTIDKSLKDIRLLIEGGNAQVKGNNKKEKASA